MTALSIRHTGIVVCDMAQELAFYRDHLGLEVWADFTDASDYVQAVTGVPGAAIWMIKLKTPSGDSLELLQYRSHPQPLPAPRQACDAGINHLAVQVDDLDGLYQRLRSAGIVFHCPPRISSDGGAKVTYCRDPEGVLVELVELLKQDPQ